MVCGTPVPSWAASLDIDVRQVNYLVYTPVTSDIHHL